MGEHVPSAGPRPVRPRVTARSSYRIAPFVRPNRIYRLLAAWLERTPRALQLFTGLERHSKQALYGCRMCGQCALPATAYACPMTCPKKLRNGPCGGVAANGDCEVFPGERCVWLVAYERAAATGHEADLALLQRPVDQRQRGRSSWVNYWLGRDVGLWTAAGPTPPPVHRGPVELGMPQVPG